MRPYQAVYNRQTLDFAADADEDTFDEIEQWVNRIERTPSMPGDYTEEDEDHRELQVVVLHRVAIAYWLTMQHVKCGSRGSKQTGAGDPPKIF